MKIANIVKNSSVWKGNKYIIWTQGCNKRCKNCIAKSWQSINGGLEINIDNIINDINLNKNIDGVVISGGEPFLQETDLINLVKKIKKNKNLGIILYTGYEYYRIKNSAVLKYIDLLISGEYINNLNNNKGMAGSTNQKHNFLTSKYINDKNFYINGDRIIEFNINKNSTTMIGIPPLGFN